MRHRGPDDSGIHLMPGGRGGLVSRRLAIRDLSSAGRMPMRNDAGTIWITYNGETYNADELRVELQRMGFTFRSQSDTEVVLKCYEAWGEDMVRKLRGMFAFAVLDARWGEGRETLFLARDRLGIKPIYYARTLEGYVFASELKSLQAAGLSRRELNPAALAGFLMMGSVPNPLTVYRDVHALQPGCTLTVRLDDHDDISPAPTRYWSLPVAAQQTNDAEAVDRVRVLLEEAVRVRLVSDVPLGAFLSGGIDSSAVVALMRRATSGPIRTCSISFPESEYNESPYALAVARAAGTEHVDRVITAEDVWRELEDIVRAMDQPTVDGVNTYFVSQTARQAGVTVALSGVGGDELFGGYANTFGGVPRLVRALQLVQTVPGGPAAARSAIGRLPNAARWAKVRDALSRPATPASAYLARRGLFSPGEVRSLLVPDVWQEALTQFDPVRHIVERSDSGPLPFAKDERYFGWTSRAELSTYTHHQLLRDTDVMSMAHSLEVRLPLLDHLLVEYVLSLPADLKRRGGIQKPLLQRALGELLPETIRAARLKQGFTFPFDRWLRGPLEQKVEGLLHEASRNGWLQPHIVDQVWRNFLAGKVHWSRPWALAMLHIQCLQRASIPAMAIPHAP